MSSGKIEITIRTLLVEVSTLKYYGILFYAHNNINLVIN